MDRGVDHSQGLDRSRAGRPVREGCQQLAARSALGQAGSGDLISAASMSTSPAGPAFVLAYAGARVAMELDINPQWVQLDVASHPGALRGSVSGQYRPADQYLTGWAGDFIAVLARPRLRGRCCPASACSPSCPPGPADAPGRTRRRRRWLR